MNEKPLLVKCRHCTNSHTPKVEYHGTRVFTRCPICGHEIRLARIPRPAKTRDRGHGSKKERLRRRWAGREAERFEKLGGAA
jgi:uncharacterized Zn finger protein (UPF0148 family)